MNKKVMEVVKRDERYESADGYILERKPEEGDWVLLDANGHELDRGGWRNDIAERQDLVLKR
jgi:hypothetical protein